MTTMRTTVRRPRSRTNVPMAMHEVHVASSRRLSPQMVRVTLTGPSLAGFVPDGPDQRCKLFLPRNGHRVPSLPAGNWYHAWRHIPDGVRPVMRTYTVRYARPEDHELDIDFVLRDDAGPATRWAAQARPGDGISLFGPRADYPSAPGVDFHLLVGDATALPAIAAIVEGLTVDQSATVLIEVDSPADELQLTSCAEVSVRWLHLNGRNAGTGSKLYSALRAATLPPGRMSAWVAGEAAVVRDVRRQLVCERGVSAADVQFAGYWRLGTSIDPD